jgi:hypothetical protein
MTPEGEEILKLQRMASHSFLVIPTNQGDFLNINGSILGDDSNSNKMYVLTVDDLIHEGLVKQVDEHAFDLSTKGIKLADALIEESKIANMVPDSCIFIAGGVTYRVTYLGANRSEPDIEEFSTKHHLLQFCGGCYDAHGGIFKVEDTEGEQVFCVALMPLYIPNIGYLKDKETVPRSVLDVLFKRPGYRIVRECLMGKVKARDKGVLLYPEFPEDKIKDLPDTIEKYVDILDDPRPVVLQDCERDVPSLLIDDRNNRKRIGTTAAEISASTNKRRFYDIREHVRETLDDLEYKGLIRSEDNIHYQVEVPRLGDARRVIVGLLSDDLFDAPPPAQLAAYVPESTREFDAFLCHASEDKESIVSPFAKTMTQAHMKAWIDEKELRWCDNLVFRIQEGLSKSQFVVVFISMAFLGKKWTDTELNTALSLEIGGKTLVLPILLGITHETLQERYPIVSAKIYREIPKYNSSIVVSREELIPLVNELKGFIDES